MLSIFFNSSQISDGTIETYGRKRLIEPSQTLHPSICLFQYPKTEFYDINSDDEEDYILHSLMTYERQYQRVEQAFGYIKEWNKLLDI